MLNFFKILCHSIRNWGHCCSQLKSLNYNYRSINTRKLTFNYWFQSPGGGGGGGVSIIGVSPRLTPRISQLRREECIDVVAGREVAHEKEIHSAMQISQSWEDLTFETEGLSFKDSSTESPPSSMLSGSSSFSNKNEKNLALPKKIFDPMGLNLSGGSPSCSSPSPTRSILGQRHCYSPSFHAVNWKNGSLSPSPTRKAFATR